jgi:hypothetical protein
MGTDDTDTTSANDLGGADDLLSPMEATDSDDLLNADGDEVVDPPEGWSGVDKFGISADEQREGDTLDHRLAEEEPDVVPEVVDIRDADGLAGADTAIEGSDVAGGAPGVHRGQIDGAPEDGESLFPVVEDVTRRSDQP